MKISISKKVALTLIALSNLQMHGVKTMSKKISYSKVDDEHNSRLNRAITNHHDKVLKILNMTPGFMLVKHNKAGQTPLDLALIHNAEDNIIKEIKKRLSPKNIASLTHTTDLLKSFLQHKNNSPIVNNFFDEILSHYSEKEIKAVDKDGNTLLHKSFLYFNKHMFTQLFPYFSASEVNRPNKENETPLSLSIECGHHFPFKELLPFSTPETINLPNRAGRTPLCKSAVRQSNAFIFDAVLARSTLETVNHLDENLMIPLGIAIDAHNHRAFRKLLPLSNPKQINLPNIIGETPLHRALLIYNSKAFWKLFRFASPEIINRTDSNHDTPLHLSTKNIGGNDIFKELLSLSSYETINLPNKDNDTPLHTAVFFDNEYAFKKLIRLSSSKTIHLINSIGRTPLETAVFLEHQSSIPRLLIHGGRYIPERFKKHRLINNVLPHVKLWHYYYLTGKSDSWCLEHNRHQDIPKSHLTPEYAARVSTIAQRFEFDTEYAYELHRYIHNNYDRVKEYIADNKEDFKNHHDHFFKEQPSRIPSLLTLATLQLADLRIQ